MIQLRREGDVVTVYDDQGLLGPIGPGDEMRVDDVVIIHLGRDVVISQESETGYWREKMDKNPVALNVTNHKVKDREPEAQRALNYLEQRLAHLDEELNALASRLGPVLGRESQTEPGDVVEEKFASQWAAKILESATRVAEITARVESLTERLEI